MNNTEKLTAGYIEKNAFTLAEMAIVQGILGMLGGGTAGSSYVNPNARSTTRAGGFGRGLGRGMSTAVGGGAGATGGMLAADKLADMVKNKKWKAAINTAGTVGGALAGGFGGDRAGKGMFGEYGFNPGSIPDPSSRSRIFG